MMKWSIPLIVIVTFMVSHADAQTIVFQNGLILTADNVDTIEQGSVVVRDGKIVAVGQTVSIPSDAIIIDLTGKTLTPGFVVAESLLGMVEISGGANAAETSSRFAAISASYDVQYAINPHSTAIPVARKGGVTRAVITPRVGAGTSNYAGQAALLNLSDSVAEPIVPGVGMVWEMRTNNYGRGALFVQMKSELDDVRRYSRSKSSFTKGELVARDWSRADLEALVPVIQGKSPLAVRADRSTDIRALIQLSQQEKIRLILIGGTEAWMHAEQLADANIPVIVDPTNNLPSNFDQISATSANAAALHKAGVSVMLRGTASAHDAGKVRLFAGMAVARGLPYDAALKAITVTPARAWGRTDFGSISRGQSADIAIWSGDPFEPLTELLALYIEGKAQSLISRQDQLEEKYIEALHSAASAMENE